MFRYLIIGVSVVSIGLSIALAYFLFHLRESIKRSTLFRLIVALLIAINPIMILAMGLKFINEDGYYDDICQYVAIFFLDEIYLLCGLLLINILVFGEMASKYIENIFIVFIVVLTFGFPVSIYIGVFEDKINIYHIYVSSAELIIGIILHIIIIVYMYTYRGRIRKIVKFAFIQFVLIMVLRIIFEIITGGLYLYNGKLMMNICIFMIFALMPITTGLFLFATAREYEDVVPCNASNKESLLKI